MATPMVAFAAHKSSTAPTEPPRPAAPVGGPLWDPATGAFDGPLLRRAIIARGWTIPEFARLTRAHVATIYHALKGRRVRDSTAIRIFEALEKRSPMPIAIVGD